MPGAYGVRARLDGVREQLTAEGFEVVRRAALERIDELEVFAREEAADREKLRRELEAGEPSTGVRA